MGNETKQKRSSELAVGDVVIVDGGPARIVAIQSYSDPAAPSIVGLADFDNGSRSAVLWREVSWTLATSDKPRLWELESVPVRLRNALAQASIATIEQLAARTRPEFQRLKNVGPKLTEQAEAFLRKNGRAFNGEEWEPTPVDPRIRTVLQIIGGTVEGKPTHSGNYLQRLRELVDTEIICRNVEECLRDSEVANSNCQKRIVALETALNDLFDWADHATGCALRRDPDGNCDCPRGRALALLTRGKS